MLIMMQDLKKENRILKTQIDDGGVIGHQGYTKTQSPSHAYQTGGPSGYQVNSRPSDGQPMPSGLQRDRVPIVPRETEEPQLSTSKAGVIYGNKRRENRLG